MMNRFPVDSTRILNYLDILRKGEKRPVSVEIHPTTFCNLRCGHCIFSGRLDENSIDFKTLEDSINELSRLGTKSVILSGGEPLLYGNFEDMISLFTRHGIKYCIFTNGLKIGDNIEPLSKAETIRISLDAATRETFQKIKNVNGEEFEKVVENIKILTSGKRKPIVILSMVVHRENFDELVMFHNLASKLNVNHVQIRPRLDDSFIVSNYNSRDFQEIIKKSNDFGVSTDIEDFKEKIAGIYKPKSYNHCWVSGLICLLSGNSNIYPCCRLAYDDRHIMGNLNNESIGKIWNSIKYEEFRNKACNMPCRYSEMNELIEKSIRKEKVPDIVENVFSVFI